MVLSFPIKNLRCKHLRVKLKLFYIWKELDCQSTEIELKTDFFYTPLPPLYKRHFHNVSSLFLDIVILPLETVLQKLDMFSRPPFFKISFDSQPPTIKKRGSYLITSRNLQSTDKERLVKTPFRSNPVTESVTNSCFTFRRY